MAKKPTNKKAAAAKPAAQEDKGKVVYSKEVDIDGCDPIDVMEKLVEKADPTWLRNNGEFHQVLMAYRVQRPAILERRERHRIRWDGEARQKQLTNPA